MAMIRPETEMKDSGIQWIGDIPNNWNIKPLYACLDEINQKNNPIVTTNILSLTNTDGVIPYSERGNQGNKSKENFEEYKVVYPNTIVANSMNILIGSVGLSKYEGCVSPVYYVYMAKPQVDIRYMNYLFQMEPFQKRLRQFANGILEIRLRVSSHDILHQKVAVPDYDEQQAIADYLDKTCSKIDEIIAEAKASIDEYKELKQSAIDNATMIGIHNSEMKDTDYVWFPEMPKHWNLALASLLFREDVRPVNENDVSLSLSQVDGLIPTDDMSERSLKSATHDNWKHVIPDDLVLNRFKGHLGVFFASRYTGMVSFHYGVYHAIRDDVYAKYYEYLFHSTTYKNIFALKSNGITVGLQNLSNGNFYSVKILHPPLDEQKEIVDYLDEKCKQIDSLISEKESLIHDLEEYKKALIYEVVTGKRRVV